MTRARDLAAFVSNADGDIKFDTDTLFIDSSANRVGIGTTTPSADLTVSSSNATIHFNDEDDSTYGEVRNNGGTFTIASDEGAAASNSSINFRVDGSERMRITDDGLLTANNHQIDILDGSGDVSMRLNNLSSGQNSGRIQIDPDNTGSGSQLAIYVDGTEEVRIDSDGLKFNADSAAANALNDYETGTWSPQYRCTSVDPTITYHTQVGIYTKIGDFVHCQGRIRTASVSGGSGSIELSNLPFTSNSTPNSFSTLNIAYSNNWDADHFPHTGYVNANNTTIRLVIFNQSDPRDGFTTNPNQTDFSTGSSDNDLLFSVQYMTN